MTVGMSQRKVPVKFFYRRESDRGPYPVPPGAPIESGHDRHVIVVDRDDCRLYELYKACAVGGGKRWRAGAGAIWNLRSNRLRPRGWTSADGAGLPILPGLARYDEAQRRRDRPRDPLHRRATRGTVRLPGAPQRRQLAPARSARRWARACACRASFDTSGFPPQAQVILEALKRYGMILADNGARVSLIGSDARAGWNRRRPRVAPPREGARPRGRRHARPAEAGRGRREGNPSSPAPGRPGGALRLAAMPVKRSSRLRSALAALVTVALASAHPVKGAAAARCSPRQPLEPARRQAAGRAELGARSSRSIGLGAYVHPDFGSGLYDGCADRDPVRHRLEAARRRCRSASTTPTSRTRPVPDPAERPDRGRPRLGRRPPRDRRRPRRAASSTSCTPPIR